MSDEVRTIVLWTVLPVAVYVAIPLSAGVCMLLTPQFVHDSPKCAAWTICFTTFVAFCAAQGTEGEKVVATLVVFGIAVWWHFSKYILLLQLSRDPILRFFVSDAEKLIEELRQKFGVRL